jgi:indole-3-glycerol phosphate synthase
LVSESGINSIESINQLQAAGFNGFLVGEHLMRAKDPGEALKDLMQNPDL